MTRRSLRRPYLLLVALSVLVAALSGCAGSEAPSSAPPPAGAPTPTSVSSPAAPTASDAAEPTLNLTYAGGKVTGVQGRPVIKLGTEATIRVSSDIADEVHLHGYDVRVDVAAGGSVVLGITATIPGVFALELEKSGVELTKIQVQ